MEGGPWQPSTPHSCSIDGASPGAFEQITSAETRIWCMADHSPNSSLSELNETAFDYASGPHSYPSSAGSSALLLHDESLHFGNITPVYGGTTQAVLPFSKLNNFIFGYFDPENIFLDNENK